MIMKKLTQFIVNILKKRVIFNMSEYKVDLDIENKKIDNFLSSNKRRQTVVVQGIGFVGSAMLIALAQARNKKNELLYNVIGIDLKDNYHKIQSINEGGSPIVSLDPQINEGYRAAYQNGNLLATYSEYAYQHADIIVIDINLDIKKTKPGLSREYDFNFDSFSKAICAVAKNIREETLILLETTVPPGTTEKILYPIVREAFLERKLDVNKIYLGYSYERVMPGANYLNSIINNHRVISGINPLSLDRVKKFLESFVNTHEFPLFELSSTRAAETAKVLENSFRAMNIAFIQEWTEFAEKLNINLFEVIEAIKVRPTHRNIMFPGFGVGGYCLTKDSLLADWALRNFYSSDKHLDMSLDAIETNDLMPLYTFNLLKSEFPDLRNVHISILGVSYLPDVADSRYSPTELFYDKCVDEEAQVKVHDSLVTYWHEKKIDIINDLEVFSKTYQHDVVVLSIAHKEYLKLSSKRILQLFEGVKLIIDASNIISDSIARELVEAGIKILGVGKGHWSHFPQ